MRNTLLLILFFTSYITFAQNQIDNKATDTQKNKGYFNITKIGYITNYNLKRDLFIEGVGGIYSELESERSHAWSLQTVNGYFLSPNFSLGVAIGLDGYHNPNFNTLPVLLDVRAYLSKKKNSVYSFLNIGPSLRLGGENSALRKGMVFNIGVGYKYKVGKKLFLVSDIGFSHKTISLTEEWISTSDDTVKANGIGFSIGIMF